MNSRTKMSLGIIATLLVIVIGVMTWHQRTHFNLIRIQPLMAWP